MKLNEYINMCKGEEADIVSILSTLDHDLTHMSNEERYSVIAEVREEDLAGLDKHTAVCIAAIIEYIYNRVDYKKPEWIMNKRFKLDSIRDNNTYKILEKTFNNDRESFNKLIQTELDRSIPEFRWRNMICDGIFDSF